MQIISGKELALKLKSEMAAEVATFEGRFGRLPKLVVILVGNDAGSVSYVTGKAKACDEVGILNETIRYNESITQSELLQKIAELNTILSMITPQTWVERDPTLKDLVKMRVDISYGMLGYPVLMSADIMAFNAHAVPVGSDQVAHIEITRDIARRFNNIYKTEFFIEPEPLLNDCALICGLDGQKMGKSYNNDIKISDSEEATAKKIMSAITDPSRIRRDDPGNPEHCQVAFKYWEIFTAPQQVEQVKAECCAGSRGCADCKRQLGGIINEKFAPIRERRRYYEQNPNEVKEIIAQGSARARAKASETLAQVREIMGVYK